MYNCSVNPADLKCKRRCCPTQLETFLYDKNPHFKNVIQAAEVSWAIERNHLSLRFIDQVVFQGRLRSILELGGILEASCSPAILTPWLAACSSLRFSSLCFYRETMELQGRMDPKEYE